MTERVLIIGSDKFDTVGDSFRRALTAHYDVRVVNPTDFIPARWLPGRGKSRPTWMTEGIQLVSRLALGEPFALAYARMERTVASFRPNIILTSSPEHLPPQVVERFRKVAPGGLRVVGVFGDALVNFQRGYFFLAEFDALFFKDHYIVDKLREKLRWSHAYYLPQACDPELHRPISLSEADRARFGCDLTIAGNVHTFRAKEFEPLLDRDLKIWGDAVPRWLDHPIRAHCMPLYVAGDDKCRAMLAAKIVLNANHYAEIAGTNKRTFEVAAIGAFQLTDTPALADVFEPDVEVATFTTQSDMLHKIDHYLQRPDERASMAQRAQKRAHREHTYAHRWAAITRAVKTTLPSSFPIDAATLKVTAQ